MSANTSRTDSSPHLQFDDYHIGFDDIDDAGYDPTTETYHGRFDPASTADVVVVVIAELVGLATDRAATAVPPLFDVVHGGALTQLVASSRDSPLEVSFEYEQCDVTVSSHGSVVVEPLSPD